MSAIQFSRSASTTDRRRRRLATEIDSEPELPESIDDSNSHHGVPEMAPFPMLSRDRLIRRVISPRLWKHLTAAVVLTLTPVIYAIMTWPAPGSAGIPDQALLASRLQALRGLSGLKFFVAAQFCLVICWVRSASAVDFRGRYRWWRWMAVGLFTTSLILLTNSSQWIMDLTAENVERVFGSLDSARPALILVPSAACLALLLWRLIPDMGRCRTAQTLLVLSVVLLVVRAFAGARQNSAVAMFHLYTLELLVSGLMLSAFQLHARFVIHINPNPPVPVQRKTTVSRVKRSKIKLEVGTKLEPAVKHAVTESAPVVIAESSESSAVREVPLSVPVHSPPDQDSVARDTPKVEATSNTQGQTHPKNKSGKKQKYRRAG